MGKAKWKKIGAALAILIGFSLIGTYLYLPTLIKEKIDEKASLYGCIVSSDSIDIHWKSIHLNNVKIHFKEDPAQNIIFSQIQLSLNKSLDITAISVPSGKVEIHGSLDQIREIIKFKKSSNLKSVKQVKPKIHKTININNIDLIWTAFKGPESNLTVKNANYNNGNIHISSAKAITKKAEAEIEELTWGTDILKASRLKISIKSNNSSSNNNGPSINLLEKISGLTKSVKINKVISIQEATLSYDKKTITTRKTVFGLNLSPNTFSFSAISNYANVFNRIEAESFSLGISGRIKQNILKTRLETEIKTIKTRQASLTKSNFQTPSLKISFDATILNSKHVDINKFLFSINKTSFKLEGKYRKDSLSFSIEMEDTPCQAILDSIPKEMKSTINGMELEGDLSWGLNGSVDLPEKLKPQVKLKLANGCKVIKIPEELSIEKLQKPFTRTVYDKHGKLVEIKSGPGTNGWTPIRYTSRFVPIVFRTMEDPGYLGHRGFDIQAIENSIIDNIRRGKFHRGASTIPMQIAKNLWLRRDRTMARKIQEAFLTIYLEQKLTKDKLLELYINIVEFGPDLYGIGKASKYYFRKSPMDLTLGQSLYLASLLPKPKIGYFGSDGVIIPSRMRFLRRCMKAMKAKRLISDEEYADGIKEEIAFRQPSTYPETNMDNIAVADGGLDPSSWAL